MPNGGSDCCGSCWFNQINRGERGYRHAKDEGEDYCLIRHTRIEVPAYTYCINHPHHNTQKHDLPIGPLYVNDGSGETEGERKVWQPSPDSEEIRLELLRLLDAVEEQQTKVDPLGFLLVIMIASPTKEYPRGWHIDEVVVWQLGEFGERRAVSGLERIAGFNPRKNTGGPFNRERAHLEHLVTVAQEALAKING